MFVGVGLFNVFNLLFHFFMVRSLSPINYGHLNTLMALFMVISVPASTVQTAVTKFVSSYQVQNRYDRIRGLLRHLFMVMSMVGLLILLLISLGSSLISSFLQISSIELIVLLGVVLLFAMVIPIPWGGLQGLQKFGSLAFNLILNGGLKFFSGVLFVFLGLGVSGAMGAIVLSYFVTFFLSLVILKAYLPKERTVADRERTPEDPNPSYTKEVYRYFLPVGLTLFCFMLLTNIDLILVKHFFTPIEAGYYSIAQMVGKIILFLPIPVVMVMFPKLSALEGQKKKAHSTLMQSLMITFFLCCGALMVGFLFPSSIIKILSGKMYSECIPLVRFFCINMTFFTLILILLYYHLSTHEKGFLYPLGLLTLIQIGLIIFFHKSLNQVLLVVSVVSLCLLGITFFLAYFPRSKVIKR